MIRMIVSSFYNTIIDEEDAIPTSTMFELDSYKEKGSVFTVLTNRGIDEVLYYNESYPFIDYILAYNGSIIYDVNQNKILYEKKLDNSIIQEVQKRFKDIIIYEENNYYKIEIPCCKKKNKLLDLFRDLEVKKSFLKMGKDTFLELSPSTNEESLKRLLSDLKIDHNEVLLILGNESDEGLLKYPNAYVVSNASKELKKNAEHKTKSNISKGFESVLKKWKSFS